MIDSVGFDINIFSHFKLIADIPGYLLRSELFD